MNRRGSHEATTPETSQNGIFGCHHLTNTTPTSLTAQTQPHAACWLCALLGYFSYISVARTSWRATFECQTLPVLWAFQLQSQTAQLSAHEQPYNNKLLTSQPCPAAFTFHSSQLSPKLNSSYEQHQHKKPVPQKKKAAEKLGTERGGRERRTLQGEKEMVLVLLRPSCGVVQKVNPIWLCLHLLSLGWAHDQGTHEICTPKSLGTISGKAEGGAHRGQIRLIAFYPFFPHQKWFLEWGSCLHGRSSMGEAFSLGSGLWRHRAQHFLQL